jgi:hypothetical protein
MTVAPVTLQSLSEKLGEEIAIRSCAPVAFYMLLRAQGYLNGEEDAGNFCLALDRSKLMTSAEDWSRPALSRILRLKYRADIVSWQLQGPTPPNVLLMNAAGYIETPREEKFFQEHVIGHSVEQLVRAGYPVIVTMKPGFGSPENKNIHAVIILDWADEVVTVVDPDARNPRTDFEPGYVRGFISPDGAGSIVLPKL